MTNIRNITNTTNTKNKNTNNKIFAFLSLEFVYLKYHYYRTKNIGFRFIDNKKSVTHRL